MDIDDPIKTTVEEIRKVLNIENVIGEVIESEDKVMIPVTRMGMAFGAGMGERKGSDNQGLGAAGGGAGIEPVAVVVVFKGLSGPEGVKVMSLKSADPLSRAIGEAGSAIVEVMSEAGKMGMGKKGKKSKKAKKTEESPEKPATE
jgi:uncharacterized spore protein YtfJ